MNSPSVQQKCQPHQLNDIPIDTQLTTVVTINHERKKLIFSGIPPPGSLLAFQDLRITTALLATYSLTCPKTCIVFIALWNYHDCYEQTSGSSKKGSTVANTTVIKHTWLHAQLSIYSYGATLLQRCIIYVAFVLPQIHITHAQCNENVAWAVAWT